MFVNVGHPGRRHAVEVKLFDALQRVLDVGQLFVFVGHERSNDDERSDLVAATGEKTERRYAIGCRLQQLAVTRHSTLNVVAAHDLRSSDNERHPNQSKREAHDDTEIRAPTSHSKEQISVRLVRFADIQEQLAARRHDVDTQQRIDRQAVAPAQPTDAAASNQAADTCRADETYSSNVQMMLARRHIDVAPKTTPIAARRPLLDVDRNVSHSRQTNAQAVISKRQTSDVVTTTAHRKWYSIFNRKSHGLLHMLRTRAHRNRFRPSAILCKVVPNLHLVVESGLSSLKQFETQRFIVSHMTQRVVFRHSTEMTDVLFVDDVIRSDEMLQKIRLLQDDLFPIKYGDDFYARLKQKEILIACAMIGEGQTHARVFATQK
jgi:hypothetical protein